MKRVHFVVVIAVLAILVAVAGVLTSRGGSDSRHTAALAQATSASGPRSPSIVRPVAGVPGRATETLSKIDAGNWPPRDNVGTKGGTTWQNRDGTLPSADGAGKPVKYLEWDVNIKKPGQNRDAERIVTGSDGSAWYTGDHYTTFTRMR
jgi:guanyl-specific ribonuclease Sa